MVLSTWMLICKCCIVFLSDDTELRRTLQSLSVGRVRVIRKKPMVCTGFRTFFYCFVEPISLPFEM